MAQMKYITMKYITGGTQPTPASLAVPGGSRMSTHSCTTLWILEAFLLQVLIKIYLLLFDKIVLGKSLVNMIDDWQSAIE